MASVAKFAALNTKLDAIRGNLLDHQDYETLMTKDSVAEVARYLKDSTHYRDIFAEVNVGQIHRGEMGGILKQKSVRLLERVCHFVDGANKDFVKALFLRYEVEDLKLILRGLSIKEDLQSIKSLFVHSKEQEILDFDRLLAVQGMEDILQIVKGTLYEEAFRNVSEDDLTLREFHTEMNLDGIYFGLLRKKAERLDKEDRLLLEENIGKNIDLINLQWLYRARVYYHLTPEEILNYTLTGGRTYSFRKMKTIAYEDNPREAIRTSLPKRYINMMDEEDIYMERKIYQYLYDVFAKVNRRGGMNFGKLIAVTHFQEYEIRDIITIVEGIRYDVPAEEMKAFLIRRFE